MAQDNAQLALYIRRFSTGSKMQLLKSKDAKPEDTGDQLFDFWKKSAYKWTHTVQISTVSCTDTARFFELPDFYFVP